MKQWVYTCPTVSNMGFLWPSHTCSSKNIISRVLQMAQHQEVLPQLLTGIRGRGYNETLSRPTNRTLCWGDLGYTMWPVDQRDAGSWGQY